MGTNNGFKHNKPNNKTIKVCTMDNVSSDETRRFETTHNLSLHLGREVKPRILRGQYGALDGLIAGQILADGTLFNALPNYSCSGSNYPGSERAESKRAGCERAEYADYIHRIQETLGRGAPLLDEVRDIAVARFIGDFYKVMQNANISYVTPMDRANDVLLVKTRVKSANGLLRKAREGRTLQDFYGATIVARNWDVVDKKVRPFFEDNFLVVPEMAKFYRDETMMSGSGRLDGYSSSKLLSARPNGYESEHLLLFYPTDGRTSVDCMIPIDVHLQSLDAFMAAEWGRASLPRHHAYDLRVGEELRRRMHIPDETYRKVLNEKLGLGTALEAAPRSNEVISKSHAELF
ncbi:hypothetical protein HY636_05845 [Candidatus Woesearchaeota archaeon]|nr:hypothetical protein [Candidatus Woesearchaeota archaeon]